MPGWLRCAPFMLLHLSKSKDSFARTTKRPFLGPQRREWFTQEIESNLTWRRSSNMMLSPSNVEYASKATLSSLSDRGSPTYLRISTVLSVQTIGPSPTQSSSSSPHASLYFGSWSQSNSCLQKMSGTEDRSDSCLPKTCEIPKWGPCKHKKNNKSITSIIQSGP